MNIVEPSHKILDEINGDTILKKIELCGRIAYKSEDKITLTSACRFVEKIIKSGHESVIEHVNITVKFICDRGVSHELVRHRLCAFTQECITGDTILNKYGYTIKYLFERENNRYGRTHNKTLRIKSCDENGIIISNKIENIMYKGKNEVYELNTELGYRIKCTLNHKFLTTCNYKKLSELSVGDSIMVNGRPLLLNINNEQLTYLYNDCGLSPQEISKETNSAYRTLLTRLKELGIFTAKKNDKNKEKYQKNHTKSSFVKMRNIILNQYNNGRKVWNKGLIEEESSSVKKQANALRVNHYNSNGFGEKNTNWRGSNITVSGGYARGREGISVEEYGNCELCGEKAMEKHHRDLNPLNYHKLNIITLCKNCHKLLHYGWNIGKKTIKDKIISISYIGIEDTYDLEMGYPFHNYIANGFIVHNSTRYCNYKTKGLKFIYPFKQINGDLYWVEAMRVSEQCYNSLIEAGVSPQIARSVLPNSLKTEIVVTANLREWRHILKLRTSKAAHPQMRELMIPLLEEFKKLVPVIFDDIIVSERLDRD